MAILKWKNGLKLFPIDALSIAFTFFLFLNPMVLFDVGFQLSFSVTFAIIVSAPSILQKYHNNISHMLVTTVIAQLSALPFMLFHFFGVSLLSIFVNLIFIPFIPIFSSRCVFPLFYTIHVWISPNAINEYVCKIVHFPITLPIYSYFSFADFTPGKPNSFSSDCTLLLTIFILWEEKSLKRKVPS